MCQALYSRFIREGGNPLPEWAYILVVGSVMVVRERLDLGIYFL